MWFSPQIFAYEENERNHSSCRFTLPFLFTFLDPNHEYSFISFLYNTTLIEKEE